MPDPILASLQGLAVALGIALAVLGARLADRPPRRRQHHNPSPRRMP